MAKREGCLRREFEEWYPSLRPGIWYPADQLTAAVLKQLQNDGPKWHSEDRVPSGAHFFFRGGDTQRQRPHRTRRLDPRE